jgi:hypothetical protein
MQDDKEQKGDVTRILDLLKAIVPEDVIAILRNTPSLTLDARAGVLELLENEWDTSTEREEHEPRMTATMSAVAKAVGLQWDDRRPSDHPFGAELDGALLRNGKRVAVVELETKNRKQIDGALLDLLTHPEPRKVLVIGRSKAEPYPKQSKLKIVEKVLPAIQSLLKVPMEVGVFTESELKLNPSLLVQFIGA